MTRFTIRIKLQQSSPEAYELLCTYMALHGFTRTITNSSTLETFQLPPGEFSFETEEDATKKQILDLAKAAASAITEEYSVLVTESNGRTWYGLRPV